MAKKTTKKTVEIPEKEVQAPVQPVQTAEELAEKVYQAAYQDALRKRFGEDIPAILRAILYELVLARVKETDNG